jgi:tRNA (guanine-N7-)-methyltransferase
MRNKKHRDERLAACGHLLLETPSAPISSSAEVFGGEDAPLWLEIGCGKGDFAVGMAQKHPDARLIAFERVSNVMVVAVEKAEAARDTRPDNLRFINGDARDLAAWFAEGSLDGIYLNFSDPWPKAGHAKRRLTHRAFLAVYFSLLRPGGFLALKTDNAGLFAFTREELTALGYTPTFLTDDLHASPEAATNIMTEYERAFSEQGMKIHALRVQVVR